jgi:peptidoglycan biosynthesis protein MviN/MurJ (putative lipid II flippase)
VSRPTAAVAERDPGREPQRRGLRRLGRGSGRAVILIGTLTAAARVVGFGRQVVFAHTVGNSCLGSAYTTANQVPNIIYDIVLGGALASIMVPVLARPAVRSAADPAAARATSQIASALLTWTVLLLLPASLILAAAARPVMLLLIPHLRGCSRSEAIAVGSGMLEVFAPQILLYGLAVVLYGILQAHRRFAGPALAPVLSSLVVIGSYLAFVPLSRHEGHLAALSPVARLTLSVGTTAGVAALALTAAVPALRLRLRIRPALRFPEGVGRRVRSLAIVGIAALAAQDASAVVVTRLANGHGGLGAVVLYNYGWQVFTVPYAVLAIPIAVSAFPALSAAREAELDEMSAAAARAVLLVSWLGAALLAGAAGPAARLFATRPVQEHELALALVAFAPGLVGYGLIACLSRVLLADNRNWLAAVAMAGGWLIAIVFDVIVVSLAPTRWVVPALGLGNTAGMAVSAAALLAAVRRVRGAGALQGVARAAAAGLAGAVAGAAAAGGISAAMPVSGFLPNAAVALIAGCAALTAFGMIAYVLDGGDLRAVLVRVRRGGKPRGTTQGAAV